MRCFIDRHWIFFTGTTLLVISLLLGLQGFDLTDEGFVLVGYQNFFDNVQYASHMFGVYLTVFVGGIWEKLFGWGGWYSFRIFNALVIVGGYVLTCYTLKDYWRYKWFLFVAFVVVMLNMNAEYGAFVFHYDTFCAFTNCLIGFLLYYTYKKENNILLFISSVVLGINVFVRIPNVTLSTIPLVISTILFLYKRNVKSALVQFLIIFGGILIGVGAGLFLMYCNGHLGLFIETVIGLSNKAQDANDNHGIIPMLKVTFVNMKYIMYEVLTIIMILFLILRASKLLDERSAKWKKLFLIGCCALFFIIFKEIHAIFQPNYPRMTLLIAFTYTLFIVILKKNRKNKEIVSLVAIFLLISVLQPLGSDYGIGNMGPFAIWGLIPVAIVLSLECFSHSAFLIKYSMMSMVVIFMSYMICSFGSTVYKTSYRDPGLRVEKTYRIKNLALASVLTSPERGEEIDALINECGSYFHEDDTVFIVLDMPGMHYLTKTKPFLGNPWPELYSQDSFEKKIKEAQENYPHPVVLEGKPFFQDSSARRLVMNKILQKYLDENNYSLVWESEHFKLYK